MPDLPAAHSILPAGQWSGAYDLVTLTYDARFLRRKRLVTAHGEGFLVDLAGTVSLNHGDALVLEDGRLIEVIAAEEPLLEITGGGHSGAGHSGAGHSTEGLHRLAWHIGNRHTPCQIEDTRLLIRQDHVLLDMLKRLGAHIHLVSEPFLPEGGAYGMGRTMGHDHGGHVTGAGHGGDDHVAQGQSNAGEGRRPAAAHKQDDHDHSHDQDHDHTHSDQHSRSQGDDDKDDHIHRHTQSHSDQHSHRQSHDHDHIHRQTQSPETRFHGLTPVLPAGKPDAAHE